MSGRLGPLAGRAKLDHWQRLTGAMAGGPIDRLPVSLWRHFPVEDETAAGLAEANVRWQRRFQFDLVKFMPTGTFSVEDWGVRTDYVPSVFGTRRVLALGAEKIADWERLRPLDPGAGCLGVQVEGLARTVAALDGDAGSADRFQPAHHRSQACRQRRVARRHERGPGCSRSRA